MNEFLDQSEGITNAQSQTHQEQGPAQVIGHMYGNQGQSVLGQQPHSMQPGQGVYGQQPHTYGQHQGQPQWTMPFVPQQQISTGPQGQQLTMMHPVQQTPPSFRAVMDMTGLSPMPVTSGTGSAGSLSSFLDVGNNINLSGGSFGTMVDRTSTDTLNTPSPAQKEKGQNDGEMK